MPEYADYWKSYWDSRTTTEHELEEISWLEAHATEFASLIPDRVDSVLEIGCADGRLSQALGFNKLRYTGVDFSTTLLERLPKEKFREDAQFYLQDGSKFQHDAKYDLIFSNAVIQNFDDSMLRSHLKNAVSMLTEDGTIIWGDVPDEAKRFAYMSGRLQGKFFPKGVVAYFLGRSSMLWFQTSKIKELALEFGLIPEFTSARDYPYRFHIRLTKGEGSGKRC